MQNALHIQTPWQVLLLRHFICSSVCAFCLAMLTWANSGHRYMYFWIGSGVLTQLGIFLAVYFFYVRPKFHPGMALMGFTLVSMFWIACLVTTCLAYWPRAGINDRCDAYVRSVEPPSSTVEALAWVEQTNICKILPGKPRTPPCPGKERRKERDLELMRTTR